MGQRGTLDWAFILLKMYCFMLVSWCCCDSLLMEEMRESTSETTACPGELGSGWGRGYLGWG